MCLIGYYLHILVGCILCLQGLDIWFRRRLGWGWSKIKKEERCLGWLIAALGICCRREKKLFQLFWPGITLHEWGYLNPFFTRNAVKKKLCFRTLAQKGGRGTGKITNFINNQFGILLDRGGVKNFPLLLYKIILYKTSWAKLSKALFKHNYIRMGSLQKNLACGICLILVHF